MMTIAPRAHKYAGLSPEEPFKVTPQLFHQWKTRRVLFVDELDIGDYYYIFRVLPSGSTMRPHNYSDVEYVAGIEILVSKTRGANAVTFGNYLVFTYELYGKEWFAVKII